MGIRVAMSLQHASVIYLCITLLN